MGVMQDNEREQDQRYADDLTPEQQRQADQFSGGAWEKAFFGGVVTVLLICFGGLPLSQILPMPIKIVMLTVAVGAFLLTCVSIGQSAKARKQNFLASQQANDRFGHGAR